MLDLHGAPGSQSGESNTGCSFKYNGKSGNYYWDNEVNKEWTLKAVTELAKICRDKGNTCYGVELLNEPAAAYPLVGIDRWSLLDYYHKAIKSAREVGLPMEKPLVINEWLPHWPTFWMLRWNHFFPEHEYGNVQLDAHLYLFMDSIFKEEVMWSIVHWPLVWLASLEAPIMIAEYTLSTSTGVVSNSELQGWAEWIQSKLHRNGTIGSAHWLWNNKWLKMWSMRTMSTLVTKDAIDWKKAFSIND